MEYISTPRNTYSFSQPTAATNFTAKHASWSHTEPSVIIASRAVFRRPPRWARQLERRATLQNALPLGGGRGPTLTATGRVNHCSATATAPILVRTHRTPQETATSLSPTATPGPALCTEHGPPVLGSAPLSELMREAASATSPRCTECVHVPYGLGAKLHTIAPGLHGVPSTEYCLAHPVGGPRGTQQAVCLQIHLLSSVPPQLHRRRSCSRYSSLLLFHYIIEAARFLRVQMTFFFTSVRRFYFSIAILVRWN